MLKLAVVSILALAACDASKAAAADEANPDPAAALLTKAAAALRQRCPARLRKRRVQGHERLFLRSSGRLSAGRREGHRQLLPDPPRQSGDAVGHGPARRDQGQADGTERHDRVRSTGRWSSSSPSSASSRRTSTLSASATCTATTLARRADFPRRGSSSARKISSRVRPRTIRSRPGAARASR